MSLVTVSFNLSAIPVAYQSAFLERVCQLNLEYQTLTAPVPPSPPAEALPMPTEFKAVDGDESVPVAATKKERKNPWASLSEEQRKERLAKLAAGREAKKARKMSEDSLVAPEPPVVRTPNNGGINKGRFDGSAPEAVAEADAGSETSSKKERKNAWANYTPEQKLERLAKMAAARKAKKEAKAAAATDEGSA
jgi:hypothetical protein